MAEKCGVCLEELATEVLPLKCGHQFHMRCIADWLVEHATCPVCRKRHRQTDVGGMEDTAYYFNLVFLTGYVAMRCLELMHNLFRFGVFVKGMCRLDENASEFLCIFFVCLKLVFLWPVFVKVAQLLHVDDFYLSLDWLAFKRHLVLLGCLLVCDVFSLLYRVFSPDLSLMYYAMDFVKFLLECDFVARQVANRRLYELEPQFLLSCGFACLIFASGKM